MCDIYITGLKCFHYHSEVPTYLFYNQFEYYILKDFNKENLIHIIVDSIQVNKHL